MVFAHFLLPISYLTTKIRKSTEVLILGFGTYVLNTESVGRSKSIIPRLKPIIQSFCLGAAENWNSTIIFKGGAIMAGVRFFGIGVVLLSLILSGILSGMGESLAAEKKFPVKPINVIIPFQPGDTDNNLRPFTDKMAQYLGQPLNFVYKPGASGAIGAGLVAAADPDGYTLVGSQQSSLVIVPLTQ
jgi:hypothetical protein